MASEEELRAALEMHEVQYNRAERMTTQRDEAMAVAREAQEIARDAIVTLKVATAQRDELYKWLRIVLIHGMFCEHYDNQATEAALAAVNPDWMTNDGT